MEGRGEGLELVGPAALQVAGPLDQLVIILCQRRGRIERIAGAHIKEQLAAPIAEGAEMIDEPERERAERRAAEGVALARAVGFEAQPVVLEEERNVWQTLRDYAADHASPVVVAGARGRSRLASVLLGGVSSGLVHHAPAPVLIVPGTARVHAPGPIVYCDDGS